MTDFPPKELLKQISWTVRKVDGLALKVLLVKIKSDESVGKWCRNSVLKERSLASMHSMLTTTRLQNIVFPCLCVSASPLSCSITIWFRAIPQAWSPDYPPLGPTHHHPPTSAPGWGYKPTVGGPERYASRAPKSHVNKFLYKREGLLNT